MKVKSVILLSFLFLTANICTNAANIEDFGSQEIDDFLDDQDEIGRAHV